MILAYGEGEISFVVDAGGRRCIFCDPRRRGSGGGGGGGVRSSSRRNFGHVREGHSPLHRPENRQSDRRMRSL